MIEGKEVSSAGQLRYGMVGGGEGSFIGDVHRKAIAMDGLANLVAGCFSIYYDDTVRTAKKLCVSDDRVYKDFKEMASKESAREDGIDFVSICTPNATHFPIAKEFLEADINVVCEKPLTVDESEAKELAALAKEKNLLFAVTYAYSGYAMVKHAREMVRRGDIGEVRVVMGEYAQDWLATRLEDTGNMQASWRTDPSQTGKSNCVGDIGSHIENTVSYITGLKLKSICASLDSFVPGRTLDDNAEILVRFDNGARGVFWASQVAVGHDNGLKIRIFGSKGSIEWEQENPNYLKVAYVGGPVQILSRGGGYMLPSAANVSRIPAGHPEGYYEAFANIYRNFATTLIKKKNGEDLSDADFPTVEDGLAGVRFIGKAVESSQKGSVWVDL